MKLKLFSLLQNIAYAELIIRLLPPGKLIIYNKLIILREAIFIQLSIYLLDLTGPENGTYDFRYVGCIDEVLSKRRNTLYTFIYLKILYFSKCIALLRPSLIHLLPFSRWIFGRELERIPLTYMELLIV